MKSFLDRLTDAQAAAGSRLCVGLDPDPARLPTRFRKLEVADAAEAFCREIIEATAPLACAFKPNLAFFEALGHAGWRAFERVVAAVPKDRLVIADAKRGDIGNTARMYARAFFDRLDCDAITVAPYMGRDAVAPFLEYDGRCAFSLVLTSNPGASDLQELEFDGQKVFDHVADWVGGMGGAGTPGFVVGATRPERLAGLRERHPSVPFLIPGVGAQGGTTTEVMAAAASGPMLVNVGRTILYASRNEDFAEAAREAAEAFAAELPAG